MLTTYHSGISFLPPDLYHTTDQEPRFPNIREGKSRECGRKKDDVGIICHVIVMLSVVSALVRQARCQMNYRIGLPGLFTVRCRRSYLHMANRLRNVSTTEQIHELEIHHLANPSRYQVRSDKSSANDDFFDHTMAESKNTTDTPFLSCPIRYCLV